MPCLASSAVARALRASGRRWPGCGSLSNGRVSLVTASTFGQVAHTASQQCASCRRSKKSRPAMSESSESRSGPARASRSPEAPLSSSISPLEYKKGRDLGPAQSLSLKAMCFDHIC